MSWRNGDSAKAFVMCFVFQPVDPAMTRGIEDEECFLKLV